MSTVISCNGISHSYGNKLALNQVDFSVDVGEPIALVGPNGAGKTTLFSILCGYLKPTTGRVEIFGEQPNSPKLFGRVGALPQDALLDPRFSVLKQLLFFGQLQGMSKSNAVKEAERVLDLVGLVETANVKPQELSHGMRKRIAIAQALLGKPELILLDEPTAGLDPANARVIRKLIGELSSEATFMVSSHNLDELEKLCRTILYLEGGKLSQQQIGESSSNAGYLTIQLLDELAPKNLSLLQKLSSVEQVEQTQRMEYLITYDDQLEPYFDQQLLGFLADNALKYRQLIKGRSLEEQLFTDSDKNVVNQ
ncbi:ABC transporter ATP-binding protein [Thalassotalea sp. M1531]|uniref:ABC transporter ATP-binding protein n=1 Tax=Thalassotalea algicola TaxID=2716224 RepID=A0A7Y0Q541_9GAMM|nr:ABC transporter ATP-binding protein [Thalassotalea algicola]NMP30664.1 ABC transporter ATP-binding protein [Thalassotalea algicola]